MRVATYKILTEKEFRTKVIECFVDDCGHATIHAITERLLEFGFPKYDKDNLGKFVSETGIFFDTFLVDIDNSRWLWMVSGDKAIVVEKNS